MSSTALMEHFNPLLQPPHDSSESFRKLLWQVCARQGQSNWVLKEQQQHGHACADGVQQEKTDEVVDLVKGGSSSTERW